jgi:hypothetical protein
LFICHFLQDARSRKPKVATQDEIVEHEERYVRKYPGEAAGRNFNTAGPAFFGKCLSMSKASLRFLRWEERTTAKEEEEAEERRKTHTKGVHVDRDALSKTGALVLTDRDAEEYEKKVFGPYKAERLLHFSARTFAIADLGEREAWVDFYDAMLEVYHRKPANEGYVGAQVTFLPMGGSVAGECRPVPVMRVK